MTDGAVVPPPLEPLEPGVGSGFSFQCNLSNSVVLTSSQTTLVL
jgi:hypothetical protein